jgi:hypothetical protein
MSHEASTSEVEVLVGFVGPSPREGYIRIYASLAFRDFCEVRQADVLHSALVDAAHADGPTVVGVPGTAHIDYVKTHRNAGDASYVMGALRDENPGIADPDQLTSQEDEARPVTVKENPVTPVFACSPPVTPVLYCVSDVYPPCD